MLLADLVYQSDLTGKTYTVRTGFRTNFASVPRAPLMFLKFGGVVFEEPALHDSLYESAEEPREVCDRIFLEALLLRTDLLREDAEAMYAGVRMGGESHYGPNRVEKPPVIPHYPPAPLGD